MRTFFCFLFVFNVLVSVRAQSTRNLAWFVPSCKVERINGLALGAWTGCMNKGAPQQVINGLDVEIGLGFLMPLAGFCEGCSNGFFNNGSEQVEVDTLPIFRTVVNGMVLSPGGVFDETIKVNGINISGISTMTGEVNGITIGGFFRNMNHFVNGASIGGVLLGESIQINGLQLGVIGTDTKRMRGLQISLFTRAKYLKGVQIGLVNKSQKMKGVQIGLWNKSDKRALPFLNFQF